MAEAVGRGRQALRQDDRPAARRWLERAHRLAPSDPAAAFLLAAALAGQDDRRSLALLRLVVAVQPSARAPHVALVAAALRADAAPAAAAALHDLLLRFAAPEDAGFIGIANQVCAASGAAGWCGMTAAGQLLVSTLSRHALHIERDGMRSSRVRRRQSEWLTLPAGSGAGAGAGAVTVTMRGTPLLGSGFDPACSMATLGCVELDPAGDLIGWACLPWNPEATPSLTLDAGAPRSLPARDDRLAPEFASEGGLLIRRGFRVPAGELPSEGVIRVRGADGKELAGSPVALTRRFEPTGMPAGSVPTGTPPPRPIDVVIPVYRSPSDLAACLAGLRRELPPSCRIVLVDDAAPDPALQDLMRSLAASGEVILLRHGTNLGFPAAANTGLRHAGINGADPRDVLLLNTDTLTPAGLVQRLAAVAYGEAGIGSVTPLSTDGSIVSYPRPGQAGPPLTQAGLDRLDALAAAADPGGAVELPTGVGFCMFIRHDCLQAVGPLREDLFAQGYGEENDWCLRARHLGWRHVAATGVVVAHAGGRSFGAARQALLARNGRLLERLHPGYDAQVAAFEATDPLAPARRALDAAAWPAAVRRAGAVILVSHALGGGVRRFLEDRCGQVRDAGLRPIVLTPAPGGCRVTDGAASADANLVFRLPDEWPALQALLAADGARWVELHHTLGHDAGIAGLPARLGLPYDVFVHDFHLWCPRITFCGPARRYCGQPGAAECEACIHAMGSRLGAPVPIGTLRARSAAIMRGARRVVAPSQDTADRVAHDCPGLLPVVRPWEAAADLAPCPDNGLHPAGTGRQGDILVVVPGAIGVDKGFDVLLACAWDAAQRALRLRFVVVGHTMDDGALMATGRVFVTGAYAEAEAVAVVAAVQADLGFIPSVWPETWCYTLSTLLQAGLPVGAFDLGAQAERIRASGAGFTMALGLPSAAVNALLMRHGERSRAASMRSAPDSLRMEA